MKYIKYKTRTKIVLCGDDDVYKNSSTSLYKSLNSNYTNGKNLRFNLNGALNDLQLSHNARCIMESCYIPTITGTTNYFFVRLGTTTQDKTLDTKLYLAGNPVLAIFKGTDTVITNSSEFFYNVNVPINFLTKGFIELQIEAPAATSVVDYLSTQQLYKFFISLIIVDEDDEDQVTQDESFVTVNYKNYGRLGAPIRTPLS